MKKRTTLMTNSKMIYQSFAGKYCTQDHQHQKIEGSEGGLKRSEAAQVYPPNMINAICQAVLAEGLQCPGFPN